MFNFQKLRHRRGANAIEFALTLPVFLVVMFGMMEYGWYFSRVAAVQGALGASCREGSIIDPADPPGSLSPCTGNGCVTKKVMDELTSRLNQPTLQCTSNCTANVTSAAAGSIAVKCVAEVSYQKITGYIPIPTLIRAETEVRLEYQRATF